VPGYGAADAIQQGLDGWFGVYNLWIKELTRGVLANAMLLPSRSDRHSIMTAPDDAGTNSGAPAFRRSSGPSRPTCCTEPSSVLNAILKGVPNIERLFGHSKGGLAIKDAIQSLPQEMTQRLHVVTFGCSIAEDTPTAGYSQFLGMMDGLGLLTAFNPSHTLIATHHSTNTSIPLSMPVSVLTRLVMIERGTPAARPPAARGAEVMTTRQHDRAARQRSEEGIDDGTREAAD
jgi:hypothetical protein